MNNEQLNKIRSLRELNKTQIEIAKELNISQRVVSYWLSSDEERKEIIKKSIDSFRRLTLEQRRKVYKRRLPYLREYQKRRYNQDEKFKEKCKERWKRYYNKMKGGRK